MKKALPYLVTSLILSAPALAQQPEAAGKEMKETKIPAEAQARMDEKRMIAEEKRLDAEEQRLKGEEKRLKAEEERMQAEKDNKGMAKQAEKKAEQERKEMGKGSEQGQAARAENSKKWWQFWKD